jgi:transaldolase/glucose-6-phosphate isomerase
MIRRIAVANPLIELEKFGQSIWYDYIRRGLITSGELARMVEQDGLKGVTSNPAIFEKALVGSSDYDQATKALVRQGVGNANDIYERLAIEDIQWAADVLYPVFVRTAGRDGFVSFEVSPHLAHDTQATIDEARRLRAAVGRDNVMIKVPATPEGIPAIRQLISEGLHINVTLLFALQTYERVVDAYVTGLEQLASSSGEVSQVSSVASFFISRIDSLVDEKLSQELDATRDADRRAKLKSLVGKVAIANAQLTYARYHELYASDRWKALAAKGARVQRLLWASTSTKNPKYSPTMYVDALIGPDTVNTLPAETFDAYRKTGVPRAALTENAAENLKQARDTMRTLAEVGISMKAVTDQLVVEGVKKFSEPFDKLLGAVEKKRQALLGGDLAQQTYAVGDAERDVQATLDDWRTMGKVRRLWSGDASLWTGSEEGQWLGWLHVVEGQRDHEAHLDHVVDDARSAGFRHVLLLGMGGSSLCPEVLRRTFGIARNFPELLVLDSTVPAQIRTIERRIDPAHTLFIVSSKSGRTIEPNSLKQYFMDKVRRAVGAEAGSHFIAITDPGTPLHKSAKAEHFRCILHGVPSIGGRFSALSHFGMAPAALMGIGPWQFLDNAEIMVHSCASCVPPEMNPGVVLGAILGTLAKRGRDKVTFIVSPAIDGLGAWLEQLLAESTGKDGKGLVPIAGERLGPPDVYGADRVFVDIRLNRGAAGSSADQDKAVAALERAGHAVVRIVLDEAMDLGQEFFRWEIATAVAGSILGVHAFNQPDVEAAKVAAQNVTAAYEQTGTLPAETPLLRDGDLSLFADPQNADAIASAARTRSTEDYLAAHLRRLRPGDYFAINAFIEMNEANDRALQQLRHAVRDAKRVATTLGYGPRFLHSTGQLHKGGPNTGVFLQITCDDAEDLPIPGQKYTFGVLKKAQAQGDFEVLGQRGRRLLRVHLGPDVPAGLARLADIVGAAARS